MADKGVVDILTACSMRAAGDAATGAHGATGAAAAGGGPGAD